MEDDIELWLEALDLSKYRDRFSENEIAFADLSELTEVDLKEMGLPIGPRRRVLKAIAEITDRSRSEAVNDSTASETVPAPGPAAERRQLTVMFCDMVGSTALSQRLDPEDMREVMRRYQDAVSAAVTQYGGHIAKYLGDGVLAYFGWPQAHEDQAERAVRAGIHAVAAVQDLTLDGGIELQARAGIATGLVVVGDLVGEAGRDAEAVSGETPNLAARLQGVAGPGEVAVGEATRRLIGEAFELDDLGEQHLKGFPDPVPVWLVAGERTLASRFEAAHSGQLTAFVGREPEIAMLQDRWAQARQGEGQVVLLSGEAGIGKSRIVQTLSERAAADPHTCLRFQCSAHDTSTALHPFIIQLERAAQFEPDDTPDAKFEKLEALLSPSTAEASQVLPLIASLLSVPVADRDTPQEMTPQQQKRRVLEALADWLLGQSAGQPVLVIFEDAHWVDPTSLEVLGQIVDRVQGARVLIVITHRPEFIVPWHGHTHITSLALNRLGRPQCAAIIASVTGGKTLPSEVLDLIVAKTDGVPLFAEELTKNVLESGRLTLAGDRYELAGPLSSVAVPSTLQDSLMARLDRLAPVKEVAQIGAVIGREFSYALLTAAAGKPEPELQSALDQLVSSELVFMRGRPPESTYLFKHALIRDAAYESLLRGQRQKLHARVADLLTQRFSDMAANRPELIAYHLSESGQSAKSIEFWIKAAKQALSRASHREAFSFADNGLNAVQAQVETPETMAVAVDVRLLKYAARYPLGKPRSVLPILAEAERIAAGLDDPVRLSKVLSVQTYVLASDGQVDAAIAVGQRNVGSITENDGVNVYSNGKLMLGRALYAAGRYAEAIQHAKDTMALVGEDIGPGKRGGVGLLSHTVNARAWLVLCHAERGEFEQGLDLGGHVLRDLEGEHGVKHEWLWMENAVGRLNVVKGDFEMAVAALEPVWLFCESNYPVYLSRLASTLGTAYAGTGDVEKGLTLLRQADDEARSTGFHFGRALVLAQHADVLLMAGRKTEAWDKASGALEMAWDAGERGNEGWAACVMGGIAARRGQWDEAKAYYTRSLELADALDMEPLRARCLERMSQRAS